MSEILTVRPGTPAHQYSFETFFQDDFKKDLSQWYADPLEDSLHRAGNNYLNDDGTISEHKWQSPEGARWSGQYNAHQDKTSVISPDGLIQRIHAVNEPNPYRESYCMVEYRDEGSDIIQRRVFSESEDLPKDVVSMVEYPVGEWRLYMPWLSTGGTRMRRPNEDDRVEYGNDQTDFSKPHSYHSRGTYMNMRCNYEYMMARNARHNIWSMPNHLEHLINTPENPCRLSVSDCYDEDATNAIENDIIEYVRSKRRNYELISQKLVGGDAGDSANGSVNHTEMWPSLGIDLSKGVHDIGCAWNPDGTHDYYIDGKQTNNDPRSIRTINYLILAMEGNTGVRKKKDNLKPWQIPTNGPKRPPDVGLTGANIIEDVDLLGEHRAIIHDVSLHKMTLRKAQVQGFTPKPEVVPVPPIAKPIIQRAVELVAKQELTHDDAQLIDLGDVPEEGHVCSKCGHVDGSEYLFKKVPDAPMPVSDRFTTPMLSVRGSLLMWSLAVEDGLHGVNIEHNARYLTTVTDAREYDIGTLKGQFIVKAVNKEATKTSKDSNVIVIQ